MSLCHWQNSDTRKRGEHDSWKKQNFVLSFLESVPGEAEEMKSGQVTSDQPVLNSKEDQEAGSDTTARCTPDRGASGVLNAREFCWQCLFWLDRTGNLSGIGKDEHGEGLQQAHNIKQHNNASSTRHLFVNIAATLIQPIVGL